MIIQCTFLEIKCKSDLQEPVLRGLVSLFALQSSYSILNLNSSGLWESSALFPSPFSFESAVCCSVFFVRHSSYERRSCSSPPSNKQVFAEPGTPDRLPQILPETNYTETSLGHPPHPHASRLYSASNCSTTAPWSSPERWQVGLLRPTWTTALQSLLVHQLFRFIGLLQINFSTI